MEQQEIRKCLETLPKQVVFCHPRDKKAIKHLVWDYPVGIIAVDFMKRGETFVLDKEEYLKRHGGKTNA